MVDQRDAGARLVGARPLDHHLRAVGLAEGGGEGVVELGQFAFLAAVLELGFAVGQLDQHLAGLDDVAGAHERVLDVAVGGGCQCALDLAFDARLGRHAGRERNGQQYAGGQQRGQCEWAAVPGAMGAAGGADKRRLAAIQRCVALGSRCPGVSVSISMAPFAVSPTAMGKVCIPPLICRARRRGRG
ncbi:hypothetical protein [Denitromonas sp.]|uniref:hypothetical protein n=1 Tax=Denitromonas sp. TaxID=2734609 RepID=UPI003A841DA3